jgi:hypothetical protein
MLTNEKAEFFLKHGIAHVMPSERVEFEKLIDVVKPAYSMAWDNGLGVYIYFREVPK